MLRNVGENTQGVLFEGCCLHSVISEPHWTLDCLIHFETNCKVMLCSSKETVDLQKIKWIMTERDFDYFCIVMKCVDFIMEYNYISKEIIFTDHISSKEPPAPVGWAGSGRSPWIWCRDLGPPPLSSGLSSLDDIPVLERRKVSIIIMQMYSGIIISLHCSTCRTV